MALLRPRVRRQIIQSILTSAITGDMRHLSPTAYAWLLHIEFFHTLQDHQEFCDAYQASGRFKADLFRAKGEALEVEATPGEVLLHALQEENAGMMVDILRALGDKPRVHHVHRDDCLKYCTSCGGSGKTLPAQAQA